MRGTDAAVDVGVEWRNPTPWPTVGWPTGERCSFLSCPWETIAVRLLFKTIVVIYYYEWDPWISSFQLNCEMFLFVNVPGKETGSFDSRFESSTLDSIPLFFFFFVIATNENYYFYKRTNDFDRSIRVNTLVDHGVRSKSIVIIIFV